MKTSANLCISEEKVFFLNNQSNKIKFVAHVETNLIYLFQFYDLLESDSACIHQTVHATTGLYELINQRSVEFLIE